MRKRKPITWQDAIVDLSWAEVQDLLNWLDGQGIIVTDEELVKRALNEVGCQFECSTEKGTWNEAGTELHKGGKVYRTDPE